MGKNRLFIPQETLDSWVDEQRADVESNELTLADDGRVYHLAPAVRFLREATGADDPNDLVGRVKEEAQLTILGADAYMDSVILEDNAYDVCRGFVAVPTVDPTLRPSKRISQLPLPAPGEGGEELVIDDGPPPRETPPHPSKPPLASEEDAGESDGEGEEEEGDELAEFLLRSLK